LSPKGASAWWKPLPSSIPITEREQIILTTHFGIGTDEEESFLTSERVRQLHNQGLAKLRRKLKGDNRNLTVLANYLEWIRVSGKPAKITRHLHPRASREVRSSGVAEWDSGFRSVDGD
jgi:hypothetical protein